MRRDGERVESRHADDRHARRERQALHRCQADSQPGERAGPEADGEQVHIVERCPIAGDEIDQRAWQPHGVGLGRVPRAREHEGAVAAEGNASARERSVERECAHLGSCRRRRAKSQRGQWLDCPSERLLYCLRSCPDLPTLMAVPSNEAPAAAASGALTPAMRQYHDAKRQYRDAIVFFRMGDFYEMFFEDALVASRALELTLTSRSKDPSGGAIPMCGVPFHAVDGYLARLVRKGYRVAICDQVEDPKKAKGVVRREVTRVVSPGTLLDANYLDAREPAFMMSLGPDGGDGIGAALLDLTTGEFTVAEYAGPSRWQAIDDELRVLAPRELVVPAGLEIGAMAPEVARGGILVTTLDDWQFDADRGRRTLSEQLRAASLDGFGLSERTAAIQAAGGLVA